MDEHEKDLYERVISMQATMIDGLMKDKEELYKLLETGNQEKRLLIESDRDTKSPSGRFAKQLRVLPAGAA
jgi:hypothetical protein